MVSAVGNNLEGIIISRREFFRRGIVGAAASYPLLKSTDASACMGGKPDAFYKKFVRPMVDNPVLLKDFEDKAYVRVDALENALIEAIGNPEKFTPSHILVSGHLYQNLDEAKRATTIGANTHFVEFDGMGIPRRMYNSNGYNSYSFLTTRSLSGCGLIIQRN